MLHLRPRRATSVRPLAARRPVLCVDTVTAPQRPRMRGLTPRARTGGARRAKSLRCDARRSRPGTPDRVRPVPTRAQIADAARGSRRELAVAAIVFAWIALGAGIDSGAGIWRQRLVGVLTWTLLVALLRGEQRSVRIQVVVVILVATCVEYTASPFLGLYTYRLHNVPIVRAARPRPRLPGGALHRPLARWPTGCAARFITFALVGVRRLGALGRRARAAPGCSSARSCTCSCVRFIARRPPAAGVRRRVPRHAATWSWSGPGWGRGAWACHDPTGILTIGQPAQRHPGRILLPRRRRACARAARRWRSSSAGR